MTRFVFALVLCLLALPAAADDTAEANKLMIEAIALIDAVEREPSAEGKVQLLEQAHDSLRAIIERFPTTDLAVKLATGQRIGNVSLAGVRSALETAREEIRPMSPGAPVRVWQHGSGVVAATVFGPWDRALIMGQDGTATVRDIGNGEILHTWQHRSKAAASALSTGAGWLLTAGTDRLTTLREVRSGRLLGEWQFKGVSRAVALSPNGGRALIGMWSSVFLFDLEASGVLHAWDHEAPVTSVAYSPNGRQAFMGLANGNSEVGDVNTGATLHRWKHPDLGAGGAISAAFSPDGRQVLAGAASGFAVLRDVQTGEVLHEWDVGYGFRVTAVAFSPDGRLVLTGNEGREVQLHDADTGRTLRKWRYDFAAGAVAFADDGRRVLLGFGDGSVFLCDLVFPRQERGYEQTILTRNSGCW